jgi:hypothetical protein
VVSEERAQPPVPCSINGCAPEVAREVLPPRWPLGRIPVWLVNPGCSLVPRSTRGLISFRPPGWAILIAAAYKLIATWAVFDLRDHSAMALPKSTPEVLKLWKSPNGVCPRIPQIQRLRGQAGRRKWPANHANDTNQKPLHSRDLCDSFEYGRTERPCEPEGFKAISRGLSEARAIPPGVTSQTIDPEGVAARFGITDDRPASSQ